MNKWMLLVVVFSLLSTTVLAQEESQRGQLLQSVILKPGNVTYMGGLSRDQLQPVVKSVFPAFKACFVEVLLKDPTAVAKMVVATTVAANGKVEKVALSQRTYDDDVFTQCLTDGFSKLKFPPTGNGKPLYMKYPFTFQTASHLYEKKKAQATLIDVTCGKKSLNKYLPLMCSPHQLKVPFKQAWIDFGAPPIEPDPWWKQLKGCVEREAKSYADCKVQVQRGVARKGTLTREEIQRVMKRSLTRFTDCYNKELVNDPDLQGKIVAAFTIEADGLVKKVSSSLSTMDNERVNKCVLKYIRRMKFPEPKGGGNVFVKYPFVFNSK